MNVSRPTSPRPAAAFAPSTTAAEPEAQASASTAEGLQRRRSTSTGGEPGRPRRLAEAPGLGQLPSEIRQRIFRAAWRSWDGDPDALRGVALASRALHEDARPFLSLATETRARKVGSLADAEATRDDIHRLDAWVRPRSVHSVLARWPTLTHDDKVNATPVMLACLDAIPDRVLNQLPTSQDVLSRMAVSLRNLKAVKAANDGFDGLLNRLKRLPPPGPDYWPHREREACHVIPKMSVDRRWLAFNRMFELFEDRFQADGTGKRQFLPDLASVSHSLRPADQTAAIGRVLQGLREAGHENSAVLTLLALQLDRLDLDRRAVFDEMIGLAKNLSAQQLTLLVMSPRPQIADWLKPFQGPDLEHARAQVQALRELELRNRRWRGQ